MKALPLVGPPLGGQPEGDFGAKRHLSSALGLLPGKTKGDSRCQSEV